jgi:hypothetical protein
LAIEHLAAEPLISSLFVLHGIHPDDMETRIRKALERFRGAELIGLHDGVVRIRVSYGAAQAVRDTVREVAPDAADVLVEEALPPGGFVPLSSIAILQPKGT